jgi:hypothetical protein
MQLIVKDHIFAARFCNSAVIHHTEIFLTNTLPDKIGKDSKWKKLNQVKDLEWQRLAAEPWGHEGFLCFVFAILMACY